MAGVTVPWGRTGASLIAKWLPREESAESIARRVASMITALGDHLDPTRWETTTGHRWQGNDAELADLVRSEVVRDAFDEPVPKAGYKLGLSARNASLHLHAMIAAGAQTPGRRNPNNRMVLNITDVRDSALAPEMVDALLQSAVTAWAPAAVALRNDAIVDVAQRGGWSIPVGYRIWISDAVGAVHGAANGLASQPFEGGTYLAAPDAWPADQAVTALLRTFESSGLDKIPHAA